MPFFGGKNKCHPEFISGSFQRGISSKIFGKIPKYQMLKLVQHDESYVIASEPERARQSRAAFTLAEVLITLVIIGIVAALTIPNLLQKYQEQATVKKVQKFYSNLSNAYSLAMKDNGNIDEWGITDINQAGAIKVYELLFKPHFKITKICGFFDNEKCKKTTRYSTLHNEQGSFLYNNVITLNDGETVVIRANAIYYDINGLKGPNQWGRDLFGFALRGDKSFPFGIQTGKYSTKPFNTYCQKNVSLETQGMGCAAWVVYKGNMDYLHCDDLTWDSRSCKEK